MGSIDVYLQRPLTSLSLVSNHPRHGSAIRRSWHPWAILLLSFIALTARPAAAYSVLSHEEVVDMAWHDTIVPMLRARFPGITPDAIREAHAYAYGGSVIQDIGYYPFGSHYFSDLLHYVRPGAFVQALIRDSTTPDEYAFALGALAHFTGDTIGHPAVNQVTSDENPRLRRKYGPIVTYIENPTAHLRTEIGFDVVEVAQGHYSQQNYRDFIGFHVSKPLLERAFFETYCISMGDIIKHEDLAISTYRHAVAFLIPRLTTIAFVSYKNQIQQTRPGIERNKFIYRLRETDYQRDFGNDYTHVSFGGRLLALIIRLIPKVGPFKALKLNLPNPQEQTVYLKSMNGTVDRFKLYLAQIQAAAAPLPPLDPRTATDALKAAAKVSRDATHAEKAAEKAEDPTDKTKDEQAAANLAAKAGLVTAVAERAEANVAAAQNGILVAPPDALPPGAPVAPPSVPTLPELDLDTGNPTRAGEYTLADQTYAHLLDDLLKPTAPTIDSTLSADIQHFFAHPATRTGPAPTEKQARQEARLAAQITTHLAALKGLQSQPGSASK